VHETGDDLERLQRVIDQSIERASPFFRRSFQMPDHSLGATQLAAHLQGSLTVALATVTARGEPRVAPIDALFVRGRFHVPTVAESVRARQLAKRPGASLTYFEGIDFAVIVHGEGAIVREEQPEFDELDAVQVAAGNQSPMQWGGTGVYLRIEAQSLFTFARYPERFATD
jgi:Pyridoxamine 5'-phosphate oxidase